MPLRTVSIAQRPASANPIVLLVSPDTDLIFDLQPIFSGLGFRVEAAFCDDAAIATTRSLETSAIVLLDVRLAGVANGQLLAAIHASGIHRRCAIALIAESVSEEWIAWLREGAIDDIVPRNADSAVWRTHLSTMQRGHQLYCELEQLREASTQEVKYDHVTGAIHRDSMLTLLFRETDRVQRLHGPLCLVIFAIDDFARWTNELGRAASEGLLREAADRTAHILRSYDLLGHAGPEEFLLALPGSGVRNATRMAERLRTEVFDIPFSIQNTPASEGEEAFPIRLTVSFGIAPSRGRSPIVVLREAEQALSAARNSALNSIHCANKMLQMDDSCANLRGHLRETEVLV